MGQYEQVDRQVYNFHFAFIPGWNKTRDRRDATIRQQRIGRTQRKTVRQLLEEGQR